MQMVRSAWRVSSAALPLSQSTPEGQSKAMTGGSCGVALTASSSSENSGESGSRIPVPSNASRIRPAEETISVTTFSSIGATWSEPPDIMKRSNKGHCERGCERMAVTLQPALASCSRAIRQSPPLLPGPISPRQELLTNPEYCSRIIRATPFPAFSIMAS